MLLLVSRSHSSFLIGILSGPSNFHPWVLQGMVFSESLSLTALESHPCRITVLSSSGLLHLTFPWRVTKYTIWNAVSAQRLGAKDVLISSSLLKTGEWNFLENDQGKYKETFLSRGTDNCMRSFPKTPFFCQLCHQPLTCCSASDPGLASSLSVGISVGPHVKCEHTHCQVSHFPSQRMQVFCLAYSLLKVNPYHITGFLMGWGSSLFFRIWWPDNF